MSFVSCFLLLLRIRFGQQSSVGEEPTQHWRCMWLEDFDGTCDTVQSELSAGTASRKGLGAASLVAIWRWKRSRPRSCHLIETSCSRHVFMRRAPLESVVVAGEDDGTMGRMKDESISARELPRVGFLRCSTTVTPELLHRFTPQRHQLDETYRRWQTPYRTTWSQHNATTNKNPCRTASSWTRWPRIHSAFTITGRALASVKSFDPQYFVHTIKNTQHLRSTAVAADTAASLVNRDSVHLSRSKHK